MSGGILKPVLAVYGRDRGVLSLASFNLASLKTKSAAPLITNNMTILNWKRIYNLHKYPSTPTSYLIRIILLAISDTSELLLASLYAPSCMRSISMVVGFYRSVARIRVGTSVLYTPLSHSLLTNRRSTSIQILPVCQHLHTRDFR